MRALPAALVALAAVAGCATGAGRRPEPPPLTVQGRLAADATWQGTVVLADDVQVPRGRTLRILPGTRVLVRPADTTKTEPEFLDNATELLVRGRVVVGAEGGRQVVFEPLPAAAGGDAARWGGIIFDGGEGELRNVRISGAETGVTLLAASPALSDLAVVGARLGVGIHDGSSPRIARAIIGAEETAVACFPGASPELVGVEGLSREHEALLVAPGSAPVIRGSRFQGGYADVLWGAQAAPPAELQGARLVRAEAVAAAAPAPPASPFEPRVPPPGPSPARVYRGEQFIGEDTTWEGEVLVDGTVMVSPAAQLTVAPGAVVRFAYRDSDGDGVGESEIFVQGRLLAEGTAQAPVVFTALDGAGPGRWGAINLMGAEAQESRLAWCLVEKSFRGLHSHFSRLRAEHSVFRDNYRSIQFQESGVALVDCAITGSASALRFRDSTAALEGLFVADNTLGVQILRSSFSLTGSTIAGNALAGVHVRESEGTIAGSRLERNAPGLRLSDSRAVVEGNRIAANRVAGLLLRRTAGKVEGNRIAGNLGNGVSIDGAEAVLRGNAIEGNLRFALESNAAEAVDATGNWWGPGGPADDAIWDAEDDPALGVVLTEPALAAAPP